MSSTSSSNGTRRMSGFEPAAIPLLRFDVEMRQEATDSGAQIVVEFSQPEVRRPYLAGEFLWIITPALDGDAAALREEINTPTALAEVSRPLDGESPSFRRWLFFSGGHQRLMKDVERNLRRLLAAPG